MTSVRRIDDRLMFDESQSYALGTLGALFARRFRSKIWLDDILYAYH
jgi:hypothetical protein